MDTTSGVTASSAGSPGRPESKDEELLTLEELTTRVGMSVRNIRFYTSKGLVPPPIRRGRSGFYTADHVSRLELVRELQSHGFTLSAIEKYLAAVPEDATPEQIALHRTMLAPWQAEAVVELSSAELDARAGRSLTPDDLQLLRALGIVRRLGEDTWAVTATQLAVGVGLIELGFPTETAVAAAEVYARHGREVAEELNDLFRTQVWPAYKEAGASAETIREVVERIKPLSIASLVSAYEQAMDETRRESIRARAERGSR
ncbi:MAG: MerR family transcriptional regulator [Actinobacteria bacterium]|nr:MerR family transcriptional regulator [Actinomycetota bacterium]